MVRFQPFSKSKYYIYPHKTPHFLWETQPVQEIVIFICFFLSQSNVNLITVRRRLTVWPSDSEKQKGIALNWVSRVIGDYFRPFANEFWFRWLLRILADIIHPIKVLNPKFLAKILQNFWKIRKMMVMRSHFIYMEGWSWAVIKNLVLMTSYDHPPNK